MVSPLTFPEPITPHDVQEAIATPGEPPPRQRYIFVNFMRVYAMSAVVIIHVSQLTAVIFNDITPFEWWASNIWHALSRGGSPLFTMISGMLLLGTNKNEPLLQFFRKRVVRVLVPFVIWAFVYLAYRIYYVDESLTATQIRDALLIGPMFYHLWFIQMILGLYLATPILRIYVRAASRRDLTYFLTLWFVIVSVLPILNRFFEIGIGINLYITTGYVGYYVLGFYLRDVWLTTRQWMIALGVVIVGFTFTHLATFALLDANQGAFDRFFMDYFSFNMVISLAALFLVLKSFPYEALLAGRARLRQLVMLVSSCSFGIYFVHAMLIELLEDGAFGFKLTPVMFNPMLAIPIMAATVFLVSFGVTWLLKQIPILRYSVP